MLQNINGLPDLPDEGGQSDQELLSAAVNSPNPNFIVLDKEMLEVATAANESEDLGSLSASDKKSESSA